MSRSSSMTTARGEAVASMHRAWHGTVHARITRAAVGPGSRCYTDGVDPEVRLLGRVRVREGASWRHLPSHKTVALLCYLALRRGWVERIEVATLFWPDADQGRALRNLRTLLARAKREVPHTGLRIENTRVVWDVACDVHAFDDAMREGRWRDALAAYEGPLMAGASIADAGGFPAWLEAERLRVSEGHRKAGAHRVRELGRAREWPAALGLVDALLAEYPDHEDIVVLAMEVRADAGRPTEALDAYRRFADRISDELGLEPAHATHALAEAIRLGERTPMPKAQPSAPTTLATMVGRETELTRLSDMLADPESRLVTIVGVGGVGKTLLALRAAEQLAPRYRDGVHVAFLEGATTNYEVMERIAGASSVVLPDHADPVAELTRRLGRREILLVLDNFEQALPAAPRVARLLTACPGIDALVTSRQSLDVAGERLFPLEGLAVPDPDTPSERALDYSAVRCLIDRIRNVRPDVNADEHELAAMVAIGRAVGGLPLGLELAASWARALPLEEIAAEIERGLGFLDASARASDGSSSRGIRATLERSWTMLPPEQQRALAELSVFHGGFRRAGATAVADASIEFLAGLIDRSMLSAPVDGRYRLHPLVRAFASGKLSLHPERQRHARDRHMAHFVDVLVSVEMHMGTPEEAETRARLAPERGNLHAALTHALATGRADAALRLASAWRWGHSLFGSLADRRDMLARALALPGGTDDGARAEALHLASATALSDGDLRGARSAIEEGLPLSERAGNMGRTIKMWNDLALVARYQGDLKRARELLERCVEHGTEMRDRARYAYALNNFGAVERIEGRFERARAWHREALAIGRELEDGLAIAYALDGLGATAHDEGDIAAAERTYRESVALARSQRVTLPAVNGLHALARIEAGRERFEEARALHLEALSIERESGTRRVRDRSLDAVAATLAVAGDPVPALRLWAAADRMRRELGARLPPPLSERRSWAREAAIAAAGHAALAAAECAAQGLDADRALAAAELALASPPHASSTER